DRLELLGYKLILANTYHLVLRPGLDVIEASGGLHGFSSWKGNILTDSGGYQVFSLAGLRKVTEKGVAFRSHIDGTMHYFTPESVVDAQYAFRSDIQMALDVCTGFGIERREAEHAADVTARWASRARDQWKRRRDEGYEGLLFGITQGNFFSDLRARSVEQIAALGLPGIAIGGLSVGESNNLFRETLAQTAPLLPRDIPHYLMGIGTPDYIFDAVTAGIDMFDCVFPTRIARNGTVLTWDGRVVLRHEKHKACREPIDPDCECSVCRRYSRSYLRHLFKSREMLGPILATEHNLHFFSELMDGIRSSIREGRFPVYRKATLSRYDEGERPRRDADSQISE
ncbi:MAG: tRNA guanosine(34) transglycosylase Tgt, partial [Spirochaetia bacterium]